MDPRPSHQQHNNNNDVGQHQHEDLVELEGRLADEVDEDFFEDPKTFRTLHRVIDVLGAQLLDGNAAQHNRDFENLHQQNPAYLALRRQQQVVEEAIEHMAVAHCADLNSSVVAVGKVARQFSDAVAKVKSLQQQVRDIKDSLGSGGGNSANPNEPGADQQNVPPRHRKGTPVTERVDHQQQPSAKSLRELWLKKLECEAVLSLLGKLEIIRAAPTAFDSLVNPPQIRSSGAGNNQTAVAAAPCRIGAAVNLLSNAINTMFSDDVAQVQALHKIMEQLMTRKQRAEEMIWDTLHDVLYLRTANAPPGCVMDAGTGAAGTSAAPVSSKSLKRERSHRFVRSVESGSVASAVRASAAGERKTSDDASVHSESSAGGGGDSDDDWSVASGFSGRGSHGKDGHHHGKKGALNANAMLSASGPGGYAVKILIPRPMMEYELDLEADEIRCLEDAPSVPPPAAGSPALEYNRSHSSLPRYTDPVLALRILVECLAKLGRLDDVERYLNESVERELRKIAEREQGRTYGRLERKRSRGHHHHSNMMPGGDSSMRSLKDFRTHLNGLLVAYGNVMLRLNLLAQILRHRISSDPKLVTPSYTTASSAMHSVLVSAYTNIQREIKRFLTACLNESGNAGPSQPNPALDPSNRGAATSSHERGLFSLGIIGDDVGVTGKKVDSAGGGSALEISANLAAARVSIMELPADQFVTQVLFPRTNMVPEVRHALAFRQSLSRWTSEMIDMKRELALVTNEDTSSPTYNATTEEVALGYLDAVIQRSLLPILQDEAVNGTVSALEREDAFEPILDAGLYSRSVTVGPNGQQVPDAEMCVACQALFNSTGPLFAALHRLPKGGEMYSPLVAVLEHAVLVFISRVKQRVGIICGGRTAFWLLEGTSGRMDKTEFSDAIENRRAYSMLLQAYGESDDDAGGDGTAGATIRPRIMPLAPSATDTDKKNGTGGGGSSGKTGPNTTLEAVSELDREDDTLASELEHLSPLLEFTSETYGQDLVVCTDDELMKAACLSHSLLRVSKLLEARLGVGKRSGSWEKTAGATRALREAIQTIQLHGLRVAKFCRVDMLIQAVTRMSKICKSSTLLAKDAVRLPSCVNDLGEYLTTASDNLREAGGNTIAAYALSSLEQYIPLFLIQTVRLIADGIGGPAGAAGPDMSSITLNGIEALDRSGSVLYRDLKGATSFEGSFWDDEAAADAFERSASYVAMIELDMEELESYCRNNRTEFSDSDYKLMFGMNAPRRKGDVGRYAVLKERMGG